MVGRETLVPKDIVRIFLPVFERFPHPQNTPAEEVRRHLNGPKNDPARRNKLVKLDLLGKIC